jgi:hypothetical protein
MWGLFNVVIVLFACLLGPYVNAQSNSVDKKFLDEKLTCPTPAVAQFEPWGKSGTQQICKIKHGPFVAYESGYVHVRGQYENGKPTGIWYWYDAKGNVVRTEDQAKAAR